jgi:acyl-CoA thioester hydrolase
MAFELPLRIYWEDTDAGGIVFYANYLKFFERARTEWLRSLGIGQQALREATGGIFVVSEANLKYHRPARLDDELDRHGPAAGGRPGLHHHRAAGAGET